MKSTHTKENWKKAWSCIFVFLLTVSISYGFNSLLPEKHHTNESSDYTGFYEPVAKNIIGGKGITRENGSPAIRYPPGYPVILAAVFKTTEAFGISEKSAVSGLTLLCTGLSSVFLFLIAENYWRRKYAFLAVLLWMTYPFNLWLSKQPNSEILFISVFFAAVWTLWSGISRESDFKPIYFATGLLAGGAMLVRPIAIALPIVFSGFIFKGVRSVPVKKKLVLVAVMIFGVLIPVLPWEAWVLSKTGQIHPLSNGGAPSMRDGLTFGVNPKDWRHGVDVPADVRELMTRFYADRSQLNTTGKLFERLYREAVERPIAVFKLFAIKALRALYGTDSQRYENWIILIQIPYFLFFAYSTLRALFFGSTYRSLALSVLTLFAYFWAMTILVLPILRYMVPAIGFLFILIPSVFSHNNSPKIS